MPDLNAIDSFTFRESESAVESRRMELRGRSRPMGSSSGCAGLRVVVSEVTVPFDIRGAGPRTSLALQHYGCHEGPRPKRMTGSIPMTGATR